MVELLLVVAVIGVLAALAYTGVRSYLGAAKSAEAKQHVGAISRSAHGAFEHEKAPSENVGEGFAAVKPVHELCESANAVPASPPIGTKYQPDSGVGVDFQVGDNATGWPCLDFRVSQPIHYQYHYAVGTSPAAPSSPSACTVANACYEAGAVGDVDGDGLKSRIARTGFVNPATKELRASTHLYLEHEQE
jgi:type IV pilus assembly protein PilA